MYAVVVFFHVIACLVLIFVILLQSGRGGGLSDMAGGGLQSTQKVFGTQTSAFFTKATSFCAILFLMTSIVLGILTSRQSRSLLKGADLKPIFNTTSASKPQSLPALTAEELKQAEEEARRAAQEIQAASQAKIAETAQVVEKATVEAVGPETPKA